LRRRICLRIFQADQGQKQILRLWLRMTSLKKLSRGIKQ
jgi:hypothetical protein